MGSSVDQLWDGMWGIMRAYGKQEGIDGGGPQPPSTKLGVAQLFELTVIHRYRLTRYFHLSITKFACLAMMEVSLLQYMKNV